MSAFDRGITYIYSGYVTRIKCMNIIQHNISTRKFCQLFMVLEKATDHWVIIKLFLTISCVAE